MLKIKGIKIILFLKNFLKTTLDVTNKNICLSFYSYAIEIYMIH